MKKQSQYSGQKAKVDKIPKSQPAGVWKLDRSHVITCGKQYTQQDPDQQDTGRSGFRAGRGTIDQIFILRNIIEQANRENATLNSHFVYFEKALDSIHRNSL